MLFQKTISKTNNPWMKSKQAGLSLESFVFFLVVAALALLAIVSAYNKSMSGTRINNAVVQTGIIIGAASSWGGNDKTGISMDVLCKGGYLTPEICGGTSSAIGNGSTGNPWGGAYTIAADRNTSRVKITLTNVDKSVVTSVGDALAKLSFDSCKLVAGCQTATASGTTVTITR